MSGKVIIQKKSCYELAILKKADQSHSFRSTYTETNIQQGPTDVGVWRIAGALSANQVLNLETAVQNTSVANRQFA